MCIFSPKNEIRNEIENIVKEYNIDRKNFGEYSKIKYRNVIKRFYYAFVDHEKYKTVAVEPYLLHKFRKGLEYSNVYVWHNMEWIEFLNTIYTLVEEKICNKRFYLILSQGWVYEGTIDAFISVLAETTGLLDDFYIVSKDFKQAIIYSDDGNSMIKVNV